MRGQYRLLFVLLMLFCVLTPFVWYPTDFWDNSAVQQVSWFDEIYDAEYQQMKKENVEFAWKQHIKSSCTKLGMYKDYANFDPALLMKTNIIVDDEHRLLYCQIPKVASTTWRRIFLRLSGKVRLPHIMDFDTDDVHHRYDQYLTYLADLPYDEVKYRLDNYFKFAIVREPFERLLSAYLNKFVGRNEYFHQHFGRKIIARYRPGQDLNNTGEDLLFDEFVKSLVDPRSRIPMNEHWDSFTNLCLPCLVNYDFVGKLESIHKDSHYILARNSLRDKVQLPSRTESKYKKIKTDSFIDEYYIQLHTKTLHQLYKLYKPDFMIFNYTLNENLYQWLNKSGHKVD